MRLPIKDWIAPPIFEHDAAKTRRAFLLNIIVIATLAYLALAEIGNLLGGRIPLLVIISNLAMMALCFIVRLALRRGRVEQASTILLALLMAYLTVTIGMLGTIRVPNTALYASLVVIAGLLLDARGLMVTTALSALAILGLVVVEGAGLLPRPDFSVTITEWVSYAAQLGTVAGLMYYRIGSTNRATRRAEHELIERKHVEHALQESATRFRTLIEDAPVAIHIVRDGVNLYTNRAFLKMFGFERLDEIVGQPIADHWAPEWRGLIEERRRQRLRGLPVPSDYEAMGQRKDGSQFPAQIRVTRVELPDGPATVAFLTDLTERKRAEEQLRESKEKFQSLVENTGDCIWEVDADGRYTYCSPQVKDLWGYEPQEMIGRTPFEQMKPEDREPTIKAFRALAESPLPVRGIQADTFDRNGRDVSLEISFVPFWDNRQKLSGFRGIARDITERKRAEEQLRESETRFRTLSENALAGIYIIQEHRLEYVNPALANMLGYEPHELIGREPLMFVHPDDRSHIVENMQRRLAGGPHNTPSEYRGLCKNGEAIDISVLGAQVTLNGRSAFIGNVVDITERQRAQQALRASEETYRAVVENAGIGIVIVLDDTIAYANPHALVVIGSTREQVIGSSFAALVHQDDLDKVLALHARLLAGETTLPAYQLRLKGSGQGEKWVQVNTVRHQSDGEKGTLSFLADITEQRRAEQALRESEARFRTLVEQASEGIALVDEQGSVLEWNKAMEQISGIPRAQAVGLPVWDVQLQMTPIERRSPLVANSFKSAFSRAFDTGHLPQAGKRVEIEVQSTNGERKTVEQTTFSIKTVTGHRFGSIVLDITERKRAERQLKENEERFRRIFETIPDALSITTLGDGRYIEVNEGFERMTGHLCSDVIGKTVYDIGIWPNPADREAFVRQLCNKGTLINFELNCGFADGSIRPVLESCSLLKIRDEECILTVGKDLSERKRAEAEREQLFAEVRAGREQLQALSRRLVQVQEEERRFIARELHDEVGQVLTGLKLMLDTSVRVPPEVVAGRLQEAQALVGQLIDQVQELSLDLRPTMLDDYGLLPALTWQLGRFKAQTGVQVAFEHCGLEQRLPPEIETAAYRIAQEALTNVARHAGVNHAALSLAVDGEELSIQIEDHGRGFDVKTVVAAGTSTGLSGMRERASALGGRLTVEGELGGGTRITAILPFNQALTRRVERR